jgi:Fungal chitosanase of glycosyl hydrolase group 75
MNLTFVFPWRTAALALTISLTAANARGQSCEQLAAGLTSLDLTKGQELIASNTNGRTHQSLFAECDAKNTFLGTALSHNRKCSTDKNRVEFIKRFPDGTIVFRSKMAVDNVGSPASCGLQKSQADQCATSLTFDAGSQTHFANAEELPFAVIPGSAPGGVSFMKDTGVNIGDLGLILIGPSCSPGVVGDQGPFYRLGEGSTRAHQDLGNPQCAVPGQHPCLRLKANGDGVGIPSGVTFLMFPKTRPVPLHSQTAVQIARDAASKKAAAFFDQFRK